MTGPDGIGIRETTADGVEDAVAVLEAAMLAVDVDRVRALADDADGEVLTAVAVDDAARPSGGVVLGALVLDGREIEALAVRPRRRGGGIGSALVRVAGERAEDPLVAAFDADLRPFYERLGFAIERDGGDRYRGRLDADPE